jgi:nucleoredoxin
MSQIQDLIGETVIDKSGKSYATSSLYNNASAKPVLGLYFSARWCPPCRVFTPMLIDFYQKFQTTACGHHFQIVFVSSDHDEAAFKEYLDEMPWLALPYHDRDRKVRLLILF